VPSEFLVYFIGKMAKIDPDTLCFPLPYTFVGHR